MRQRVVAAIPNYNGGEYLQDLLRQTANQPFDQVYVLDDASTDGSVELIRHEFPFVTVVAASHNEGPGVNRNRMMEQEDEAVILFVDADMRLMSDNYVDVVRERFQDEMVGLLGGLVLDGRGQPMVWNYGFEMHPVHEARFEELRQRLAAADAEQREAVISCLRRQGMDFNWVDPDNIPLAGRVVDWVAEGLFAIRSATMRSLGGYDTAMRYHEGQDLAHRIRKLGLRVEFEPAMVAQHCEHDVRGTARAQEMHDSQYYFFHKHWGMSKTVFTKLYGSLEERNLTSNWKREAAADSAVNR